MMLQSVVGGYDLYPDYDYMYIRNVWTCIIQIILKLSPY